MKKPQYRHVHWLACLLVSQPPASMAAGLDKQEPAEQHAIDTPILRSNAVLSPKEQARWQVMLEDMKRIISNRSTSPATPPTDQTKATDLPSVPKAATELFRSGFEARFSEIKGIWVIKQLVGTDGMWYRIDTGSCPTAVPYSGSKMGKFNSCVATGESSTLFLNTASFQIPASAKRATMTLRMFHDTNNPDSLDMVLPGIAADGGNFLPVGPEGDKYVFLRNDGTSGWALESMDISYLIGSTIQVAFAGMSYGGGNMYIDEVIVTSEKEGTPTNKSALESPQQNSFESGIGLIRGWSCNAQKIEVEIDGKTKIPVAYGTPRDDTKGTCGDSNNGFGLTYNWNLLGNGTHTIKAFADNVEFGKVTFTVTTLGVEYLQGASGTATIIDFPGMQKNTKVRWAEPHQNFVIVP